MVEWLTAESEKDMHHMKRMRTSREPTSLSSLSQRPPTNFDFGKHWATCIVPILSAESLEIFFDTLYGSVSFRECCPVARLQPDEWGKFLNVLFDFFLQDDARFQLLLLTESEDDRELLRELKEQHDHGVPATKINLPFFWKFLRQKLHYDWPKHKERIGFYALRRDPTWSITFGRCLVDLLFPQEVWQVRRSRRWATLYCSSRHMVFDICMWAEDNRLIDHSCGRPYTSTDPTLGGKQAWEESGECDHTFHDWSRLCVDAQSRVLDYLDLWDLLQYSFSSHSHLNDFGQLVGTRSVMTLEHFDRRSLLSLLRFSPSFQCHTFKLVTCLPASSYKESTHALRLLLQRMKSSLTTLYAPALCSSRLETMHDFMALQNIILHEPCRPLSDLFPLHLRSISIPDDVYPYVPDLAGFRQLHRLCIKVDGVRAWQALIRGIMAMPLLDMAECAFEDTRETRMNLTREENEEFFNGTWTHPKLRVLSLKIYHNDHWGNVGGYLPALEMPGLHHLEVRNAPLVQLSLGGCPNLVVGFSWNRLYFVRSVLPSLDLVKTRWCILNRSPGNLIDLGVRHVSCLHDARLHSVVDPNTNPNPNDSTTVVYHGPSIPFWSELEEQSESEPDTD